MLGRYMSAGVASTIFAGVMGVAALGFAVPTQAQETQAQETSDSRASSTRCVCETPRSEGGVLSSIAGDVTVLSQAGYATAVNEQAVSLGSRVMVGSDGSGQLTFGRNCRVKLEANTNYDVTRRGPKLCLLQSRDAFTPTAGGSMAPLAVGGLILGGIGAGVAVGVSGGGGGGGGPYLPFSR